MKNYTEYEINNFTESGIYSYTEMGTMQVVNSCRIKDYRMYRMIIYTELYSSAVKISEGVDSFYRGYIKC